MLLIAILTAAFAIMLLGCFKPEPEKKYDSALSSDLFISCINNDIDHVKELLTMYDKLNPSYIDMSFNACWNTDTPPIKISIGKLFLEDEKIYQHLDPSFILYWLVDVKEYEMAKQWINRSDIDINYNDGTLLIMIALTHNKELFDAVTRRADFNPAFHDHTYVKYSIALNYQDTLIYLLEQRNVTVIQDFIDIAKRKNFTDIVTILESHQT